MLCDICRTKEANIHIAGEGHYCCDCNNSRIAELYGINYLKQYAREVVIDDAQKRPHTFEIRNYLTPMYSEWTAIEQGDGYEFNVMTAPEDDQVAALVKLHRKIYAGLQHQSLKRDDSEFHLSNALQLEDGQYHLHQTGYGRIGYDPETRRHCLFIDGRKVSADDFLTMLSMYEGFNLFFQINDQSDDILETDSVLVPHRINAEVILESVEACLGLFLDKHSFLSYKRESDLSSALFKCWDEFELLCHYGEREIARSVGQKLINRLKKIENDTDDFPNYHIYLINSIMSKHLMGMGED